MTDRWTDGETDIGYGRHLTTANTLFTHGTGWIKMDKNYTIFSTGNLHANVEQVIVICSFMWT